MLRPSLLTGVPLVAALLSATYPVLAADMPNATTQPDASQIVLQNRSGANIVQGRVQTTDGKVWNLGSGGLASNQAAQVAVPARDCIANIAVELEGGRRLQSTGLHSCNSTKIVVEKDRIDIPQEAVPGAKQHGTPR
jgi:hypothetical protein